MTAETRIRALCVDDEPAVLDGLQLTLHRHCQLDVARSGAEALGMLAQQRYAVLMSDMRMPGIDGATLLNVVRQRHPETVRLLLTGQADIQTAALAINNGQIFRFLIKPCPPATVQRAFADAAEQYRLQTVERNLLERTLRGAVQALTEVLSLTDPEAYGRAAQVKTMCVDMATRLQLSPTWALELAAMMAPLGRISLPPDLLQRLASGAPLQRQSDREALQRVSEVTHRLLAPIPRLEPVRDILRAAERHMAAVDDAADIAADTMPVAALSRVLRAATRFVERTDHGDTPELALAELRNDGTQDVLIDVIRQITGSRTHEQQVRTLPVHRLGVGMRLCDDLLTQNGQRLVPRGFEVNASFVERIRNMRPDALRSPVRVLMPRDAD